MTSLACRTAGLSLCATVACVVAGSAVAGDPLTSQQSVADPNDARCNAMGEGFHRRRRLERLRQDQRLRRRRRRFRRRLAHGFAQFRPVRRRAGLGARDASRGQRRRPLRYADRPGAGVCPDGPRHPPALTRNDPGLSKWGSVCRFAVVTIGIADADKEERRAPARSNCGDGRAIKTGRRAPSYSPGTVWARVGAGARPRVAARARPCSVLAQWNGRIARSSSAAQLAAEISA